MSDKDSTDEHFYMIPISTLPKGVVPLKREDMRTGLIVYMQSFYTDELLKYVIRSDTNREEIYPWIDGNKAWRNKPTTKKPEKRMINEELNLKV